MKRNTFDDSRDQRIANEHIASNTTMCRADGCPNRWSIAEGMFGEGIRGLCSAHARADHRDWPAITQAEQDRAYARAAEAPSGGVHHELGCILCGTPSERAELSAHGGWCIRCYEGYVTGGRRPAPMSREQKLQALQSMREVLGRVASGDRNRGWAYRLKAREESGESLTLFQRQAWRTALRAHLTLDAARDGAEVSAEEITDGLRATGDIPQPDGFDPLAQFTADPRFGAWVAGSTGAAE